MRFGKKAADGIVQDKKNIFIFIFGAHIAYVLSKKKNEIIIVPFVPPVLFSGPRISSVEMNKYDFEV